MNYYNQICIGIDQSYKNTGVSVICDGQIKALRGLYFADLHSHSEIRFILTNELLRLLDVVKQRSNNIICILERIRLHSRGFININYIKSIGALNATIVDAMDRYNIPTYSVDTRAWKSQIVGTVKGQKNKFGVPEEKWPTVKWVCKQGFRDNLLMDVSNTKIKNGCFYSKDGRKLMFDNDIADSAAIGMYWFMGNKNLLKIEK